jgi:hypothetical protein
MFRINPAISLFPLFLFLLIYYQVFSAVYFFSDDIHQLWYNYYHPAFPGSASQGRWISGLIFDACFGSVKSIYALKYIRIFSLFSWIIFVLLWQFIFNKWANTFQIGRRAAFLMSVFIVCSIPVAIYIGWASCVEMVIGMTAGLLSGHLLFSSLITKSNITTASVLGITAGLISLFTYQNTFGMFLVPFFIYYVNLGKVNPCKIVITGIIAYCVIVGIYFLVFKVYAAYSISPNDRVKLSTDIPGKLSFLFSEPLPMTFSANLLYSSRSIFSQILAPFMMALWAISVFIRFKKEKIYVNIVRIAIILFLLIFMYLPSMVVSENFASYRTLFVLNICVFYLLIEQLLFFVRKEKMKFLSACLICIYLITTGFYNFNFQFVDPLRSEYKAFSEFIIKHVSLQTTVVYFIRADRFMFSRQFNIQPYKDEFGLPSTNKDWVPEPLVKQFVSEMEGTRPGGEKMKVVQFADSASFTQANIKLSINDLVVDMNKLFSEYWKQKRNADNGFKRLDK